MTSQRVLGSELQVGDTIKTWFSGGRDTITALSPYTGPLAHLFPKGAQITEFALNRTGMTIDNGDLYEVLGRQFGVGRAALAQSAA